MSQLEKVFSLQELLQASQKIAEEKKAGKKDFPAYASELEQLAFYFYPLTPDDVLENIEAIIAQLEEVTKTQEEYAFEFSQYVPPSLLRYWEEEAIRAAKTKAEIDLLVKNEIAAWIAGLKKKYQLPEGKLTSEELETVKKRLEIESVNIETWLSKDNLQILRKITSFQKALQNEIRKYFPAGIPKSERKRASLAVAQGTAQSITPLFFLIKTEADFKRILTKVLSEELKKEEATRMNYPAFETNFPQIVNKLAPQFEKNIIPLIKTTQQLNEKIFKETETVSATNLPLEEPPEEIKDQIQPEAGKSIRETWNEVMEWFYTQGYPAQTLVRLAKSDPTVFKGTAKTIIKTIKEGFLPGLTLREQLLRLLAMGPRELMVTEWSLTVRAWYDYLGKEKFEEEFKHLGILRPKEWQKISYELAMKLKENLGKELKAVEEGEKIVSFKEREVLLTYNRLFEFIELLKQFQESHPRLAGMLQRFGQFISWPARHPNIILAYQLTKTGPYAPRILMEFGAKQLLQFGFRSAIVKLTEGFSWGWERKYVPLIGWKTVWKPTEALKGWVKKTVSRLGKAFLRKIGLEKLAIKLASVLSGWGAAISLLWKEIKRAGKALLAGFIVVLLTLGKAAATGFTLGSLVGIGVVGFLGFKAGAALGAKIGGTIGAIVGGPIGAITGGIIGGILGAIIGTAIALGIKQFGAAVWQTITAPFAAPPTAAGLGGPGISQATAALPKLVTPVLATTGATVVGGSLLLTMITSSAFIVPEEGVQYGSRYIQIQKTFFLNDELQEKTIFENDEIVGQRLKYWFKVTIVEKELHDVKVNDKIEIIKETVTVYRDETFSLGDMEPGEEKEFEFPVPPDDTHQFKDAYLSNTVTVTSEEGEIQTLTLALTVGQPPVPDSVMMARKIVDTLLYHCPGLEKESGGVVVNQTSWSIARECLERAAIPPNVIDILGSFISDRFFDLQCIHFVVAATSGDLPGKPAAKHYCTQTTPGYSLSVRWENLQPGDIIASSRGEAGHVAIVVAPPFRNSKGEILYVEVAEAMGDTGVVRYRRPKIETLLSRYCGYLRKD